MSEELLEPRFDGNKLILETASRRETYDARFLVATLLVYVAKGDGTITDDETQSMLRLIEHHFNMRSAESLELLTRAMTSIAEDPGLGSVLRELGDVMSDQEKEDTALMMVKVIAADGKATADEMEAMRTAGEIVGISAKTLQNAYDRYFAELSQ